MTQIPGPGAEHGAPEGHHAPTQPLGATGPTHETGYTHETGASDETRPLAAQTGYPHAGHSQTGHSQSGQEPPPASPWSTSTPYPTYATAPLGAPPAQPTAPEARRGPRGGLVALVAGACLLAGAAGGGIGVALAGDDAPAATQRASGGSVTAESASTVDGTIAGAAATIMPSTVVIEVRGTTGGGRFGQGQETGGSGSGVVLDTEGNILTNAHVVTAGGTVSDPEIQVTFSDGTTADATLVGVDESSDLAVIDVDGVADLVPATFADSDLLEIGQGVVAVGAPLGLSGTVTEGIVSAVDRPVRTGDSADVSTVLDAVQTDAAINPGNSGGPLVDLAGSVVGINSAIATVSSASGEAGNIGVGFAIPSNDAKQIADQLIADGTAEHASLGVSASESEDGDGAQIQAVEPGSAAADAGVEVGDVVTAVGDRPVRDLDGLLAAVRDHQPGDEVAVTVRRGDGEQQLAVTLGSREG